MPENRATIIGCGLIGGSISLALRRRRTDWSFVCLDRPEMLPAVLESGVADEVGSLEDAARFLPQSRLVILATPVETVFDLLELIAPHLREGTIVTDVGSTKAAIMNKAREVLPAGVPFIGGHPLAGAERSGVDAANPLLFNGRVFLLCPFVDTPPEALLFMIDLVEDLLAVPITIEPEEHDRILAMLSHVPQLLAVSLVLAALDDDATHGLLNMLAGPGFLDFTRIAASDFTMWKGILETNKDAILSALQLLETSLAGLKEAMGRGDLQQLWEKASRRRRMMSPGSRPRLRKPELRKIIDHCDEQILQALGTRLRVVQRIGKLKKDRQAPVHDPGREHRMLKQYTDWGKSLDLPPALIEELFTTIIRHSRLVQSSIEPAERCPGNGD